MEPADDYFSVYLFHLCRERRRAIEKWKRVGFAADSVGVDVIEWLPDKQLSGFLHYDGLEQIDGPCGVHVRLSP